MSLESYIKPLENWLSVCIGENASDVKVSDLHRLATGHSNDTFFMNLIFQERNNSLKHKEFILRLPPEGPGLFDAYDLCKQYRIMEALSETPIPVPKMIGLEQNESVIGRPFFIMEKVNGICIEYFSSDIPDYTPEMVRAMDEKFVDMLAALHSLNWRKLGLDFLEEPEDYITRLIDSWESRFRELQKKPLPAIDHIIRWLRNNKPEPSPRITLIHGDYKCGNVLWDQNNIAALLDWEMTSIGDPIADLGYMNFNRRHAPGGLALMPGALPQTELIERYQEKSGIKVHDLAYFEVLEMFKLVGILYSGTRLFETGKSDDLRFVLFGGFLMLLLEDIYQIIDEKMPEPGDVVVTDRKRIASVIQSLIITLLSSDKITPENKTQLEALPFMISTPFENVSIKTWYEAISNNFRVSVKQ